MVRLRTQLANSVGDRDLCLDRRRVFRDPAVVDAVESVISPPGRIKGEGVSTKEWFSVSGRRGCPSGITSESEGVSDDGLITSVDIGSFAGGIKGLASGDGDNSIQLQVVVILLELQCLLVVT